MNVTLTIALTFLFVVALAIPLTHIFCTVFWPRKTEIEMCDWCDDEGWYYPTGDGMPSRIRCDHE